MELQKLRKDIGEEIEIDGSYISPNDQPIDSFIEWLQGMKQQGATHIDIDCNGEDAYEVTLQAFQEYFETPEQAKERIEAEQTAQREREEYKFDLAKATYERLKDKFENNT